MRVSLTLAAALLLCQVEAADIIYEDNYAITGGGFIYLDPITYVTDEDYSEEDDATGVAPGSLSWNESGIASSGPLSVSGGYDLQGGLTTGSAAVFSRLSQTGSLIGPDFHIVSYPLGSSYIRTVIRNVNEPVELTLLSSFDHSLFHYSFMPSIQALRNGNHVPLSGQDKIVLDNNDKLEIILSVGVEVHHNPTDPNGIYPQDYDREAPYEQFATATASWYFRPIPGVFPGNPKYWGYEGEEPMLPPDHIAGINSRYLVVDWQRALDTTTSSTFGPPEPPEAGGQPVTGYRFGAAPANIAEILLTEPLVDGLNTYDVEFGPPGEHRHTLTVGEPFSFTDILGEGVDYFHITGLEAAQIADVEAAFPAVLGMRFTQEELVKVGHGALINRSLSPPGLDFSQPGGVEIDFAAANPGGQVVAYKYGSRDFSLENLARVMESVDLAAAQYKPLYYELEGFNSELGYAGGFDISFRYDDLVLAYLGLDESELRMLQLTDGGLVDVTKQLDMTANIITGAADALGGFAVGVPTSPTDAGDFNGDGLIGPEDYEQWKLDFGMTVDPPGSGSDGNGDGRVDAADYTMWRDALAATTTALSPNTIVPEPATCLLLSIAVVAAFVRRRTTAKR